MSEEDRFEGALGPTEECLTAGQLADFLDESSDPRQRSRWQAHLAACPRCAAELSLLQEFRSATPRPEEAADVNWIVRQLELRSGEITERVAVRNRQPERARVGWKGLVSMRYAGALSLAAAGVLVVVAAGLLLRRTAEPPLASGTSSGRPVMRSEQIETAGPNGDVAQAPQEFRWRLVPGAASYEVRLMEVDRSEIWRGETRESVLLVPETVRSGFIPRKTLLWQVIARDPSGEAIARSDVQRFRVAP